MNNNIQKTNQANEHHCESVEQQPGRALGPLQVAAWIASAIALLGLVVGALFVASRYLASDTDPIQFITGNLVNALIFIAIVGQVLIYRKQRDIMEQQWLAMRDSLKISRSQVHQAYKEVDLMRKSLEIARQNMIYAQRAYVTVTNGVVTQGVGETTDRFRMRVENSGNTPAYAVQVEAAIEVREHGGRITPVEATAISQLGIIAPKHHYLWDVPRSPNRLEPGGARLYCRGIITYQDIFGEVRLTRFCLTEGDLNEDGLTELVPCQSGNEAIDESEEKEAN